MHLRLAAARRAGLRRALLGLQRLTGDGIALEDLDCLGHLADLVAASDAGHLDGKVAAGEIVHRDRHPLQRTGDATRHEDRHHEHKQQDHAGNDQGPLGRSPGLRLQVVDVDAGADEPVPRREADHVGQFRLRLVEARLRPLIGNEA